MAALRSDRPVVAYVGWTGEGNLGDEAMFAMHRAYLGLAANLVPIPIVGANPVLRALGPRIDAVCLGGGTLIANGFFRRGLTAVLQAAPDARRFMLGVGSESPSYRTGRRADIDDEFARWPSILSEFAEVRVRGPLSVEAMRSIGVTASHTGDPALLMPPLAVEPGADVIGINVGVTDDQWGGDALPAATLLALLVERTLAQGLRVRLVPTTTVDHQFMQSFVAENPHLRVEVPAVFPTLPGLLTYLAGCSALIGMKLHALILAATQHVPLIALEYRPKCRDFMTTVGLEDACFRTDQIDIDQIEATLRDHLSGAATTRVAVGERVSSQADVLRRAAADEVRLFGIG